MREYVVGYFNKEEEFVIQATMDSINVAMFVRDSYNEAYRKAGMSIRVLLLGSHEVPKNHRFSN